MKDCMMLLRLYADRLVPADRTTDARAARAEGPGAGDPPGRTIDAVAAPRRHTAPATCRFAW